MTFQDMVKKDPQGNLTAEHRTVDATGTYYLLGQPARRIELLYIYIRQSDNRRVHADKIHSI
jgi:hypothetical protein